MSQSVSSLNGGRIYLDTMIFYALLRDIDSDVVKSFFKRIQQGEFQAFTSVLTFDELAYRLLLAFVRDKHDGNPLTHLRTNEVEMIASYYPTVADKIEQLESLPNLMLVDVTASDLTMMHQFILKYHLRPRDALHLVAMQKSSCKNLASNDADFDRSSIIQRYTLA